MKIRFFNTYEPVTSLYRDLIPVLIERGAEVFVVLSRGRYRKGRNVEEALGHLPRLHFVRAFHFGVHAYQGFWAKLLVMFGYMIHAGLYALLGPRVDLNVFLTQPPFFPLAGYLLRLVRRQPYYVVLMDLQPQLAAAVGLVRPDGLVTRLFSWSTRLTLRKADRVIVIGRCMAQRTEELGVAPERILLLPNWADERQVVPVRRGENPFRKDEQWGERFVFGYAGNIGFPQYFEDFLTAAEEFRDDGRIVFVVVGSGTRRSWLESQIQERQVSNVVLYPFLEDRYTFSEILGALDLHFVSLRDTCTGFAVPSKTYGVLAAGRPVLYQGSEDSEISLMIREEEVGEVVACGESVRLAEILRNYLEKPEKADEEGRRARELAEGHYSREESIRRYSELLLNQDQK